MTALLSSPRIEGAFGPLGLVKHNNSGNPSLRQTSSRCTCDMTMTDSTSLCLHLDYQARLSYIAAISIIRVLCSGHICSLFHYHNSQCMNVMFLTCRIFVVFVFVRAPSEFYADAPATKAAF